MRRTCQPFSFSTAVSLSCDCQPSFAPASQVATPVALAIDAASDSTAKMNAFTIPPGLRRIEWMAPNDGLVTLGAGRDEVDRHAGELFDALEVLARRCRQLVVRADADGAFHPARQLFIHRLAAFELLGAHREDLGEAA